MDIQTIGVIGAGQMGNGIAHVGATSGHAVILMDRDEGQLAKALKTIEKNLDRQLRKERITEADKKQALERITTTTKMADFKTADFVIEAATENYTIKEKIFQDLVPNLNQDAIIATNTSSISITKMAAVTDRPERFMGMHFMNPVPVMKLVELISGIATDESTFKVVHELAVKMGKKPAVSEDFPAFIVNRVLLPMINEAVYALYEGVGDVVNIDTAMKLGANHPMGPLELADFIGLDTCLSIMNVLHEGLADTKYRPCPLLVKYVEAGWLGRKAGKGFYDYAVDPPKPTR